MKVSLESSDEICMSWKYEASGAAPLAVSSWKGEVGSFSS